MTHDRFRISLLPLTPGPHSARWREEQRRKRRRREARERAEREHVVGGPLVDVGQPIMGVPGETDAEYAMRARAELESRAKRMHWESVILAMHFAQGCALRREPQICMQYDLFDLLDRVGPPYAHPTHSTADLGDTTPTIPRL